jgi:hypothetical protein
MTGITVKPMDVSPADQAPPPGTAIIRPLRHVRAVRERYMLEFTDSAEAAESRAARAWAWALGETAVAPVTDESTDAPPSRSQILVEIAIADDRCLRGEREGRADAAATILRWLIGDDDHLPVRGDNIGELVGGFGDFVRSREEVAGRLAAARATGQQAAGGVLDLEAGAGDLRRRQDGAEYFGGVAATLAWILGERDAPISGRSGRGITRKDVKGERVQAQDVIEQAGSPWMRDRILPRLYGQGVKDTIAWLLGDITEL